MIPPAQPARTGHLPVSESALRDTRQCRETVRFSLRLEMPLYLNYVRELATYHEKAPYDSQVSFATYLVTGEVLKPSRKVRQAKASQDANGMDVDEDEDIGMDIFQPTQPENDEDDDEMLEEEDEDYEDVTTISVTIVNEKDLEGASQLYIFMANPLNPFRCEAKVP